MDTFVHFRFNYRENGKISLHLSIFLFDFPIQGLQKSQDTDNFKCSPSHWLKTISDYSILYLPIVSLQDLWESCIIILHCTLKPWSFSCNEYGLLIEKLIIVLFLFILLSCVFLHRTTNSLKIRCTITTLTLYGNIHQTA